MYNSREEFLENDFLQKYSNYSNIEKLACILTLSLNREFRVFNFNSYVHVIPVKQTDSSLEYYWYDDDIKSAKVPIPNLHTYEKDRLIRIISTRFEVLCSEGILDTNWSQIGDVDYLTRIDNEETFLVAVADRKSYPNSELWKHVVDVFTENWQWNLEICKENNLFAIPSPSDTIKNADYYWDVSAVACCRIMSKGGFETGYGDPFGSSILFYMVSAMASTYYEKRYSEGKIVPINAKQKPDVTFIEPIEIDVMNKRALRKFLEMTHEGFALAIKEFEVVGLVKTEESISEIIISGTNQWKYCQNGIVLFSVDDGFISVNDSFLNERELRLESYDKDIPNIKIVEQISKEASHQTHGTTVIFSDEANSESQRLSKYNRCERIEPIDLIEQKELIRSFTSIDGAILVDFNGICFSIGDILDGEAVKAGNIGRGARYNSAVNYVAWRKTKSPDCLYCAVIISEDGMINIVTSNTVDDEDDLEKE